MSSKKTSSPKSTIKENGSKKDHQVTTPTIISSNLETFDLEQLDLTAANDELAKLDFMNKVYENAPMGIYVHDLKRGSNVYCNSQYTDITGFSLSEINNLSRAQFLELYHPDDLNRVSTHMEKLYKAKPNSSFSIDHRFRHKKGHWVWLRSTDKAFEFDKKKKLKTFLGSFIDISNTKKLEEKITSQNLRFNLALKAANFGVYDWLVEENILIWDDGMHEMYGIPKSDFEGNISAWENSLHPEDKASAIIILKQTLQKGSRLESLFRIVRRSDAQIRTISVLADIIKNEKGKPIRMVGINMDVTDRVSAEKKLQKNEFMLREAENVANMGSWEFDIKSKMILYSAGAAKILGFSEEGSTYNYALFLKKCYYEDKDGFVNAFKSAILDGESFAIDHRVLRDDGSIIWIQNKGRPYLNKNAKIEKIVGTIQDITLSKRSQKRLEKSGELLKEAQHIAKVGSFEWIISEDILQCSQEFYNILMISSEGLWLNLSNYMDRIHPVDRQLTRKKIFEAMNSSQRYDIEHRILLPNNKVRSVRAIGRFETNEDGRPQRLLGTIQDISDKKRIENALLEGQEIERKRISREIHDGIGQLLAATKFNFSALDGMPAEDVNSQFEKIHKTLETTIDEARRITRNLSTKVLEELGLEKAIQDLSNQAIEQKGIRLGIEYGIDTENMDLGMQTSLYRIIQESVNNMIKYSGATNGLIKLMKVNNYLMLVVIDNGVGFNIDDPKMKSGNGINNLRQRASSLHGYLDIITGPDKGTEIQVKIPFEIDYDKSH